VSSRHVDRWKAGVDTRRRLSLWLDAVKIAAYNAQYSEVVREKCLIEKDVPGGSIHRNSSPKSSEFDAEEIHVNLA
jgi:hypothetical protein